MSDILKCLDDTSEISRRQLLAGAGKVAAGIAIISAGGLVVSEAEAAKAAPVPWPYEKLDPEEVGKIAYEGWYKAFCSYGVASGIITPLQQKVGKPYTQLPVEGLRLGEGGLVGWGTLCGSLLGAAVAVGFAAPYDVGKQIMNEMLQWYGDTQLPIYKPAAPKANVDVQTTSNSPLCHLSVGKWTAAAGKALGSPERKDRCARVTADVAMKTVMLLNDWKDGKFKSDRKLPSALYGITGQHNCTECHGGNVPKPVGM